VILLIKVVNLMIGRLSMTNSDFCDFKSLTTGCHPHPIHILKKNCKPDGGVIRYHL